MLGAGWHGNDEAESVPHTSAPAHEAANKAPHPLPLGNHSAYGIGGRPAVEVAAAHEWADTGSYLHYSRRSGKHRIVGADKAKRGLTERRAHRFHCGDHVRADANVFSLVRLCRIQQRAIARMPGK